ncbi:hypothetical protein PP352_21390 [Mycobacteroides abscessus]|nr:hypothetical protein [Mycobacteroides abscessus]
MITLRTPKRAALDAARADLSQNLVHASCALVYTQFVTASIAQNSRAAYALAWDVAPHLSAATTTIRNLVAVHDLGCWHPFWSHPAENVVGRPGGIFTALHKRPGATLTVLHNALVAAYGPLAAAEAQADALTRADHTYSAYGSIGWDLHTAIDDVLINVRAAARAAALDTHPYWQDKL